MVLLSVNNSSRRTSICRKSDMRRQQGDKRSELAVKRAAGAMNGRVFGEVALDATAIIRAGGSTTLAAGHTRQGMEEMDFGPVCVDDCSAVVCRATDRGGKGAGCAGSLGDRGRARTCSMVHMGGVHTACDRSCQTVPVDG